MARSRARPRSARLPDGRRSGSSVGARSPRASRSPPLEGSLTRKRRHRGRRTVPARAAGGGKDVRRRRKILASNGSAPADEDLSLVPLELEHPSTAVLGDLSHRGGIPQGQSVHTLPPAMPMSSDEIRRTFTSFFEDRGHLRLPSASLIPAELDPSALFTVAGMHPLKDYFSGAEKPPRNRASPAARRRSGRPTSRSSAPPRGI